MKSPRKMLDIIATITGLCLGLASCVEPSKTAPIPNGQLGFLHANSCMQGASYLVFKEKQYGLGSKSVPKLNRAIASISGGTFNQGEVVESSGCVKVYKIEFSGEFEKENALTGYSNDEVKHVVQVYQFRFL